MGRLVDESLLQEKLALIPMEERTFRRTVEELENAPTVEAIPKADYENRLRADLVAMLTEIQLEIEEIDSRAGYDRNGMPTISTDYVRIIKVNEIIQQKIDKLKEVGE